MEQYTTKKDLYDICCIGHITLDKVATAKSVVYMAGGTSFYFSNAMGRLNLNYMLVTSLAQKEIHFADKLRNNGIEVDLTLSAHTVYFENIYSGNQDKRRQRVLQKGDPFTVAQLSNINAKVYHLGPLLADDIPVECIKNLSERGTVSLDVQGYLRTVKDKKVCAVDWAEKKEALRYVHILKASRTELEVLTAQKDVRKGAKMLNEWGVKEVLVTLGSMGSVIYKDGFFYNIPAYRPVTDVVDATGCGDTYMTGYLYQWIKGAGAKEAGEFAAAMATLKIESSGPFTGTEDDVLKLLANNTKEVSVNEI